MRRIWFPVVLSAALLACESKKKADQKAVSPPAPQVKKPVDTTPPPPLAADPGGATGKAVWAAGFGGLGIDSPRDVAVGPGGEVYVAGYHDGETDFGPGGKHKAKGDDPKKPTSDAFVVKLDAEGKIAWGKTWGDKRDDVANGVAVNKDTVVVVGQFLDTITVGEFTHKAAGSDDVFAVAFKADGTPIWLFTAGSIDSDGANAVVATPDGGWLIGGSFSDIATFGKQNIKSRGGTDAMLVKLAASGDMEWVKQFGGKHNDSIRHLDVDKQGNIYVQGTFRDTADWGGPQPFTAGGAATDLVLAKYDLNGDHIWSAKYGNNFEEGASGVAVDQAGNVTMVGSFDHSISFGEGDDHTSSGEADIFVARFDNAGKLKWVRTWGSDRNDAASGVAVDAAGNSIVTGWFEGKVDFGKGLLDTKVNKDVFVVKVDDKGATVWAQSFGDKDHDQGRAVTIDDKGNPFIAGMFRFQLDVGPTPLESARAEGDRIPKADVFVVKLER